MKILVVDVGGTFIKFAVMNEKAEIIERGKVPTPLESHEDFINKLVEIYKSVEVEGITLSLPGVIDSERGICITSGALGYNNGCNVLEELEKICGVKVTIENDAKCAALAEAKIGSLANVSDGFVMVFGTGVGGAFIKNHEVHWGKHFSAGEISFTFESLSENEIKPFGELCGVPALLKSYAQIKNLSNEITGEEFFQAVEEKENDALTCLDNFTRRVAIKIFNIQMMFDPEKIAIGGGISVQESFIDSIRSNVAKIYDEDLKEYKVEMPRVEIVQCKFRNDANLIGALYRWLSR